MALTKKTPDKIKASLKVTAQGVEQFLLLTYNNRSQSQVEEFTKNEQHFKLPDNIKDDSLAAYTFGNSQMVLFLVDSFDDGSDKDFPLTLEGLADLESTWPGTLNGIIRNFYVARSAEVEKN